MNLLHSRLGSNPYIVHFDLNASAQIDSIVVMLSCYACM